MFSKPFSLMFRIKSIYFVLPLCLLSTARLRAQEEEKVAVQFLSFPKAIDPKPVELLVGENKTIEVKIPTNEFSEVYHVKRMENWAVGKIETGKDNKPAFTVYGGAKSLAAPSQLILLVRKGQENSEGMVVIPIDNQLTNFGGGQFLFVNAASLDVAGQLGDSKFVVKPGKFAIIKPKPQTDESKSLVHATLYYRKDDVVKPFFSSTWPVNNRARTMVFFYEDPSTGHLSLHSIRDFF